MAEIKRVALAGKGRFGSRTVKELVAAGFETTILTRSAAGLSDVPPGVQVLEVDYDSDESLQKALQGQDAVVSTVAMTAIPNQKRMIDAAIAVGVKHFIPAEFTIETQDPRARRIPMMASVVDIEDYLTSVQDKIDWNVVHSGACIEFSFDVPFIIDFDGRSAELWDGGQGKVSLGSIPIAAQAIVGVLKQPSRVKDHVVRVHGAVVTQEQILRIAETVSGQPFHVKTSDSQAAIKESQELLGSGKQLSVQVLTATLIRLMSAATFGAGEFAGFYDAPDNEWLGVKEQLSEQAIEDAVRYRIEKGKAGHAQGETLDHVSEALAGQEKKWTESAE